MIYAPKLKKNARIGIIAPSYWMPEKDIFKIADLFLQEGFELIFGISTIAKDNVFAGTPGLRANDINNFFKDPDIDAIICLRGGYGANRILDLIDYKLIRKNPKIFLGYSDITAIHMSIYQKTGLVTFHGPMPSSFKRDVDEFSFKHMINMLKGKTNKIPTTTKLDTRILKEGNGGGKLLGGNLTLLINRLGTNDQVNFDNSILFIEEVNEYLYAFDRQCFHLRKSGTIEKIKGLVVGELAGFKDEKVSFGKTTDEIIMENFGDLNVPIVTNFPCGHGQYQVTIPIGAKAKLNASSRKVSLELAELPFT